MFFTFLEGSIFLLGREDFFRVRSSVLEDELIIRDVRVSVLDCEYGVRSHKILGKFEVRKIKVHSRSIVHLVSYESHDAEIAVLHIALHALKWQKKFTYMHFKLGFKKRTCSKNSLRISTTGIKLDIEIKEIILKMDIFVHIIL